MVARYDFEVYAVYMDKSSYGHLLPILNKEKLYVWAIKELLKIRCGGLFGIIEEKHASIYILGYIIVKFGITDFNISIFYIEKMAAICIDTA